jgi:hypothetical protein
VTIKPKKSRNPFQNIRIHPKLQKSVVTFVDILGYRELISAARTKRESAELLKRLHNALSKSRQYVDPEYRADALSFYSAKDKSAMRAFTDNIVIGRPVRFDAHIELAAALQEISYFQLTMARHGFFVRGGVAIGHLYMDDITVFGSGLLEAYNAEVHAARDPRIVLADSAQQAVDRFLQSGDSGDIAAFNSYVLRDSDGQYFVDYLSTIFREDGEIHLDELRVHRSVVSEKLASHRDEPSIWSKYRWVANYHNFVCNESSKIDKNMKIHPSELAESPMRLVHI